MIAAEEIGAALLHVVRASYGIDEAEAVTDAVRPLGYKQAGPGSPGGFGRCSTDSYRVARWSGTGSCCGLRDGGEGS